MKNIRFKNKQISIVDLVCVIILAYLAFGGLYKCPFKLLFGIPCPSCGMTRALKCAIHGDIKASLYYHPLWPLAVLTVIAELLYEFKMIRLDPKYGNLIPIPVAIALVICYVIRMVMGIDI